MERKETTSFSYLEGATGGARKKIVLSMYKCIQNLERSIPQQRSVSPTSTSTDLQITDSLPQSEPSVEIETQMSETRASAVGPGQARAGPNMELGQSEQTQRISWKTRREEDLYYLRTIEVRGFYSEIFDRMIEDPTKSPYHWATKILSVDTTEGIIRRCRSVKFFRGDGGQGPSIRITFDSIGKARRALIQAGGARNELRNQDSDTVLQYHQLSPPDFTQTRKNYTDLLAQKEKEDL